MIKQKFKLEKYSWKVYVYYDATKDDIEEVVANIKNIHLPNSYIKSAYTILDRGSLNKGLTFTNSREQSTVIVITKTTSASQFVNSFFHEIYHLVNHIAQVYRIDYNSEEVCYLAGHIAQIMHRQCNHLMCECCHNE